MSVHVQEPVCGLGGCRNAVRILGAMCPDCWNLMQRQKIRQDRWRAIGETVLILGCLALAGVGAAWVLGPK